MWKEVCWARSERREDTRTRMKMVCVFKMIIIQPGQSKSSVNLFFASASTKTHATATFSPPLCSGCYLPSHQENGHHQLKASSTSLPLYTQYLDKISPQEISFVSIYEKKNETKHWKVSVQIE